MRAGRRRCFPASRPCGGALAATDLTLPGLRLGISAGSPLQPELAHLFATRFGLRLHSFYGSSETGGITYDRTGAAAFTGRVGRALRGVKLTARPGQRLQVAGAAVLTHGNRRRGTWIMPDRVQLDTAGHVTLLGRRGQTGKIAGRRVNLAEVSDRLRQLPGVHDAWVGFGPGPSPVLGAVVATGRTVPELRAALQADTAPWKIPRKLFTVTTLPLTARGKPDTRALQARLA